MPGGQAVAKGQLICIVPLNILFNFLVACEAYAAPVLKGSKRKSILHYLDLCSGIFDLIFCGSYGHANWQPLVRLQGLISRFNRTDSLRRVNVNDPGLITLVNKLQDVFTTVGVCQEETGNASAYTFIMLGTDRLRRRFKIP